MNISQQQQSSQQQAILPETEKDGNKDENIFHSRITFKRLKTSNHPPHYYHNTIVHILFMLPEIREIILSNDWSENKPMHHLQKTFIKLNDDKSGATSIKCHNFWDLIGYPQKGYPKSSSSFQSVLNKLPKEIKKFCSFMFYDDFYPTRYRLINLGKCMRNNNKTSVPNKFKPQLIMNMVPFMSKDEDTTTRLKEKLEKNRKILCDILYFWMNNNQNMIDRFRDCGKLIEQYMGYEDGKLYYDLISVVMASNLDKRFNRYYWSYINDVKHECCGNNNESNHWYLFKKATEIKSVNEITILDNLIASDFKEGVAHIVVYRQISTLINW